MELIERDGKYYMKLANGELEITKEQAMSMVNERGAVIRNNLKNWMENFAYRRWEVIAIPTTAAAYIDADTYFNDLMREMEELYHSTGNDHAGQQLIDFCTRQLSNTIQEKGSSANPAFHEYEALQWQRVLTFIYALTGL